MQTTLRAAIPMLFLSFALPDTAAGVEACPDGRHIGIDGDGKRIVVDAGGARIGPPGYWLTGTFSCDAPVAIAPDPGRRSYLAPSGRTFGLYRTAEAFHGGLAVASFGRSRVVVDEEGRNLIALPQAGLGRSGGDGSLLFLGSRDGKSRPATREDVLAIAAVPYHARAKAIIHRCSDGDDVVAMDGGIGYGDYTGRVAVPPRADLSDAECFGFWSATAKVMLKIPPETYTPDLDPAHQRPEMQVYGYRCTIDRSGALRDRSCIEVKGPGPTVNAPF